MLYIYICIRYSRAYYKFRFIEFCDWKALSVQFSAEISWNIQETENSIVKSSGSM